MRNTPKYLLNIFLHTAEENANNNEKRFETQLLNHELHYKAVNFKFVASEP